MKTKFAFHLQQYNLENIRYIIVGDNPGEEEFKENTYFVGSAGKRLREHFESNNLCSDFEKECFLFNKTFISTSTTGELDKQKKQLGADEFDKILKYCALNVANLSNHLDVPVLIFGKSKLSAGKIFHPFWKKLREEINDAENILVFGHPSHAHFDREWKKYKKENMSWSNQDLLKKIGSENYKELVS